MLRGAIEVQALAGRGEAVVGQPPDPHRPVGDHQRPGRLAPAPAQRLGGELCAHPVAPGARGHKASLAGHGAAAGRLPAVVQAEDCAGVDPVPASGLLTVAAPGRRAAPGVAFAHVPGVDLKNHLAGIPAQFGLLLLLGRGGGRAIQWPAPGWSALALARGFAVQRGAGRLHAGQPFPHDTGFADRQLGHHQRGHLLHRGRVAGGVRPTQGGVGGAAPFVRVFALAPGATHPDGAEAGLAAARPGRGLSRLKWWAAVRAARRGGLGLLLGARFGGLAQQFPGRGGDGGLDVAEVLVARLNEAADGAGQGDGQWGGRPGEGFGAAQRAQGQREETTPDLVMPPT